MKRLFITLISMTFPFCLISCGTNVTQSAPLGKKQITPKPGKGAVVVYFPEYWHFYGPVGFHISTNHGHKSPPLREGQLMVFDVNPSHTTISTEASSYAKGLVKAGEAATSAAGFHGYGVLGDVSTRAKKQAELIVEKGGVYYFKISRNLVRETLVKVPPKTAKDDLKTLNLVRSR